MYVIHLNLPSIMTNTVAEFHYYDELSIICITIFIIHLQCDFISVHMPYKCDKNNYVFMECIYKLSTTIGVSCPNNIVTSGT